MVSNSVISCSLHTLLLLSLSSTTLAATNLFSRKPPARLLAQLSPSSHFQDASSVVIAAQCRPGELVCNDGCMPSIAICCADGGGGYCKQGYSCVTDGCCPIGHVCGDEITCDIGEVSCGEKKCMPKNAVCCPSGSYCQAGEECFQNGFDHYCQRAGGGGNPNDGDGSSKTTGGTIGIAETSSSRRQSTSLSSKTTQREAPASTSTETQTQTQAEESTSTSISSQSTSSIPINHPVVTPFLPKPSTTSTTTTEVTSSSTTEAAAASTTSGGNPAAAKISGVTLALVLVSIMMVL